MGVVAFSQRDPRWAGEQLGTSGLTLGKAGCLVTAAASLLASWGHTWDPKTLNVFLRQSHGYVDDCLFLFAAIDALGARCTDWVECFRTPAPLDRLANALGAGSGVLAMVDWQPGGKVEPHWVRVMAGTLKAGSWQVMDPWQAPGNELVSLSSYLAPGWDPARGIFMVALYSEMISQRQRFPRLGLAQQPAVCVRQED